MQNRVLIIQDPLLEEIQLFIKKGVAMSLRIVVPDGSMQEKIMDLFNRAGLPITIENRQTGEGKVAAQWIDKLSFRRPQRIPLLLEKGHYDISIVGQDWLANWELNFPVLLEMAMGRASNQAVSIVLAVPKDSLFQNICDFPQNCEVASEYVELTKRFFTTLGRTDILIDRTYGKTEAETRHDATAIVDISESGIALTANNLRIIEVIMISNTVIVAHPKSLSDSNKKPLIDWFVRLIKGSYQASLHMELVANVPRKKLDAAAKIMGGLKGPTCSPIYGMKEWFALVSIVPRDQWDKISFELLQIGVTDIIPKWEIPCIMS